MRIQAFFAIYVSCFCVEAFCQNAERINGYLPKSYSPSIAEFFFASPAGGKQTSKSIENNNIFSGGDDSKCYIEFSLPKVKGVTLLLWPRSIPEAVKIRLDQSYPNFVLDNYSPSPIPPQFEEQINAKKWTLYFRKGGRFRPKYYKVYTTRYIDGFGFCGVIVGKNRENVKSAIPELIKMMDSIDHNKN